MTVTITISKGIEMDEGYFDIAKERILTSWCSKVLKEKRNEKSKTI